MICPNIVCGMYTLQYRSECGTLSCKNKFESFRTATPILWLLTKLFHKQQAVCCVVCIPSQPTHWYAYTVKCHRTQHSDDSVDHQQHQGKKHHQQKCQPQLYVGRLTTSTENGKNLSTFLCPPSHKYIGQLWEKWWLTNALSDRYRAENKKWTPRAQLNTKQYKVQLMGAHWTSKISDNESINIMPLRRLPPNHWNFVQLYVFSWFAPIVFLQAGNEQNSGYEVAALAGLARSSKMFLNCVCCWIEFLFELLALNSLLHSLTWHINLVCLVQ